MSPHISRLPVLIFLGLITFFFLAPQQSNAAFVSGAADYDGDGFGDLILYDQTSAIFTVRLSSTGALTTVALGSIGDVPALGDYNGDGKVDLATFNRSDATWTIATTGGSTSTVTLGNIGDVPVPGDYTGGGCSNVATFNSTTATWTIGDCDGRSPSTSTFGSTGDVAVAQDYDCDGKFDKAVFNRSNNNWSVKKTSNSNTITTRFGLEGDIPVPGAYIIASCAQVGLYRPSNNTYYIGDPFRNGGKTPLVKTQQWGISGDIPAVVNVDGNDHVDYAVYRPSDGNFYIMTSSGVPFIIPFGTSVSQILRVLAFSPVPEIASTSVAKPATSLSLRTTRVKGDFNGDGKSDMTVASVDRSAGTTTWAVLHNDSTTSSFVTAASGDALTPGDFDGNGTTQPGVVFVRSDSLLEWHYRNAAGLEAIQIFGENGDSPIVGDFDCDGKDDKAVVRPNGNGFLNWYFSFGKGDYQFDYLFGIEGDKVFAANMSGDSCDELIATRDLGGEVNWFYQRLNGSALSQIAFGLSEGDIQLPPSDLDGDGKADLIVVRGIGGGGVAFVRYADGNIEQIDFGLSGDVPLAGQFTGANRSELGVFRRGAISSFFQRRNNGTVPQSLFGTSANILVRPDGTVVQPTETGIGGTTGGGGGGNGGAGCTASPGTDTDFSDGSQGSLWKPISEGFRGNVVILMPSSYQSATITILGSDGQPVSSVGRTKCCDSNGGRMHWWLNDRATTLASSAPLTVKFERNGITECRSVPNPTQRYD